MDAKISRAASTDVRTRHEEAQGRTLKKRPLHKKVTSRKQAIAIGLSRRGPRARSGRKEGFEEAETAKRTLRRKKSTAPTASWRATGSRENGAPDDRLAKPSKLPQREMDRFRLRSLSFGGRFVRFALATDSDLLPTVGLFRTSPLREV